MFNKLYDLIEHGNEFEVLSKVSFAILHLLEQFEDERTKEGSYPAAIDAICEILQEYKKRHLEEQQPSEITHA